MDNGFIYPITVRLVSFLHTLNLVEYVKMAFVASAAIVRGEKLSINEEIAASNIAIDLFMVAKWAFVIQAIVRADTAQWVGWVVWYLIVSNLFTYFYYHVWRSGYAQKSDIHSQRRRYVGFILSLCFYLVCYAYLYQFQYYDHVNWPDCLVDTTNSIYLSIANAFTLTYGGFSPKTQFARVLFASELINTFFFLTIIVVNSVPSGQNESS